MDSAITVEELTKLKLSELKKLCTKYSVSSAGSKADLVSRLMENRADGFTILQPGDEAKLLDEVDDAPSSYSTPTDTLSENVLGESVELKGTTEAEAVNLVPSNTVPRLPTGLKRPAADLVVDVADKARESTGVSQEVNADTSDGLVTTSQSTEDRLEARAKRFGLVKPPGSAPLGDDKLAARARRFGLPVGEAGVGLRSQTSPELVEKLQKRAERFGIMNSSIGGKADEEDRKALRLKRFGPVDQTAPKKLSPDPDTDAQRAVARAQKFGIESDRDKLLKRKARFGLA